MQQMTVSMIERQKMKRKIIKWKRRHGKSRKGNDRERARIMYAHEKYEFVLDSYVSLFDKDNEKSRSYRK